MTTPTTQRRARPTTAPRHDPAQDDQERRGSSGSLARITLIGHLGADPEVRSTQDGRMVARFRMAINRARRAPDDTWAEETDWYGVTAFGPLAERAAERLARGARAYVEGRLEVHVKEGGDGQRTYLDVVARDVVPLDRRPDAGDEPDDLPFR